MCLGVSLAVMRATWVPGAAAVFVLVASAGCGTSVDTPAAGAGPSSSAQPAPSRGPAIALPAPGAVDVLPDPPLTGPADPVAGVDYPYDLLTHCGIRWARFGGREWAPPSPLPEPGPPPAGPDGVVRYNGYTRGTMTLVAPDLARFEVDGTGQRVDLGPITVAPPPCA